MADTPDKDDDKLPEADAEERFNRTLRNLLNTPHKPHKPAGGEDGSKPGKRSS
jgi:hypothetical protein